MPEHSGDENVFASTLEFILMMMMRESAERGKAQLISRIVSSVVVGAMRYRVRSAKVPSAPSLSAPERTIIRV
jgi:hypothetical protein